MLYANAGHSIEAVVTGVQTAHIITSGSSSISARRGSSSTLVITGKPSGISAVSVGNVTVIIADKHTVLSFWNIRLPSASHTQYDQAPDVPSVLIFGPYLVRNATLDSSGSTLVLNGDINATTTLDIVAPPTVKAVTWNGQSVRVQMSRIGTLRGQVTFDLKKPELPDLKAARWRCTDSLPEIEPGFNDSTWVTANKTSTARPYQPLGGNVRA